MSATRLAAVAAACFVGFAALAVACSDEPPARLPDNVTVAIVYNEQAERWHAGAIVSGDRPGSFLRVVCLTEAGIPEGDAGREHTGINIDAQPGELDGRAGLDWFWHLDGQPWSGGRWGLDHGTTPATVVASDPDEESALFHELRNARVAELSSARDGQDEISLQFDLTALFDTPVQFAIDDCDADVIEARTGDYHSAYAYWLPDFERHSISLSVPDPEGAGSLALSCGPTALTDDDAPDWIRNANGDVYAAATLFTPSDDEHLQAESPSGEVVAVSWVDGHGDEGTSIWDQNHGWLQPFTASDNLRFIDALRSSKQLTVTIEAPGSGPVSLILRGATLFAKPMGAELDACIREYADLNG